MLKCSKKKEYYFGRHFTHFLTAVLAAAIVEAHCSSGMSFQTLAIVFVANIGYPGTGGRISLEVLDLVDLTL